MKQLIIYLQRLKAIRNCIASAYGYDDWVHLRREAAAVREFNCYYKLGRQFRSLTGWYSAFMLGTDWEESLGPYLSHVRYLIKRHRERQVLYEATNLISEENDGGQK